MTASIAATELITIVSGFQLSALAVAMRTNGRRRRRQQHPRVCSGCLLPCELGGVARVRRLVALLGDDQALLRAEADLQTAQVVLAVVVVLVEDRDLRVRRVLLDPLRRRRAPRRCSPAASRSSTGTACTGAPSSSRPWRRGSAGSSGRSGAVESPGCARCPASRRPRRSCPRGSACSSTARVWAGLYPSS